MQATITQTDLNKSLSVVNRVVPTRGQLPILSNILIEAGNDGIYLSATNLEIGVRVFSGGKVTETGAITVPAKSVGEFISTLPGGNVDMKTDGDKLTVKGGRIEATFTGIGASEFPVIAKLSKEDKTTFTIKKNILEEVASHVAFAAATDESRPVLTGVKFEIKNEKLYVTATDGFRLSRKIINIEQELPGFEKGLTLPSRTIMELSRVIGEGKKEDVEVGLMKESNQIVFAYDGTNLSSRILEGNFPDVDKIIPAENKTEVIIDKSELLRAIKAIGIFARESSNVIRFTVEGSVLKIEASSSQTGEGKDEIEIQKTGEDGQIAFNYRYVQEFLSSMDDERISFRMNDSLAPGVFGSEKDLNLTHLIMPVRI